MKKSALPQRKISPRHTWRLPAVLLALAIVNVAIFVSLITSDGSAPKTAFAQGGSEATDKAEPIDQYPVPGENGSMQFSLRDPWDKTSLTYFFHNCPSNLDCEQARQAIRDSFQTWANVSSLTFSEVTDVTLADMEVTWASSGDPEGTLGTPSGVLAYCFFPRYGGDMWIDDSEPWTIGDGGPEDIISTAVHEIGHGIGLGHSEYTTAIMYPYAGYANKLGEDDINAIQSLYGPPGSTTSTPTNTTPPNGTNGIPSNNVPGDVAEVEGEITNKDSAVIFDLPVEANTTVTVTMEATGGDLDPYVGIMASDRSAVIVENDNFDTSTNAQVKAYFADAGDYIVVATRFGFQDGSTTGPFKVTAAFETGDTTGGTNPNVPPGPTTFKWRVSNYTDIELCGVFFSSSDASDWGPNQIEGNSLAPQTYFEWDIQPGTYDVQVADCNNNTLEAYKIEVTRDLEVQIYLDRITPVPLGTPPQDTPTSQTPQDQTATLRISNLAGTDLCEVYFSPSTETNWGENRLQQGEKFADQTYIEWAVPPGSYDIKVFDCFNNTLEAYQFDVTNGLDIQVNPTEINSVPLQ
ncbi:MAG: matrixin family metalloprotease [Chloroflexi bacterium]|nr:matrixin family metalloprotease [Chloroflexota bacterium]